MKCLEKDRGGVTRRPMPWAWIRTSLESSAGQCHAPLGLTAWPVHPPQPTPLRWPWDSRCCSSAYGVSVCRPCGRSCTRPGGATGSRGTEHLWASYLATARREPTSAQPGRRFGAARGVAKAAAIRPSPELRSEAASPWRWWTSARSGSGRASSRRRPDRSRPPFERYARNNDEQGHISVRRVSTTAKLLALEGKFAPVRSPGWPLPARDGLPPSPLRSVNLDTGQLVVESR